MLFRSTQVWIEPEKERVILVLTNVMETEFCSDIMKAVAYKTHNNKKSIKKSLVIDVKLLEGDYLISLLGLHKIYLCLEFI